VLPLLAALSTFFGMLPPIPDETTFEYRGDVQNVLSGMIPKVYNRSYSITADLVVPEGGAEGVIVAEADHLGGFSLYVKDGRSCSTSSRTCRPRTNWTSTLRPTRGRRRTDCRPDTTRGGTLMPTDDETTDVLIGGYLSTEAAHEDYEAVLGRSSRR